MCQAFLKDVWIWHFYYFTYSHSWIIFISSDIRPNFLFWARGNPVALLRGLNRPLLTRLIQEELALECKKDDRPQIEIDMASVKAQYICILDSKTLATLKLWYNSRVFLQHQLWIINYCVKSSSNNHSNENINTGVSVVFKTKIELKWQNELFLKYHFSGNTSLYVFITDIIWRTFDVIIDDP